MKTEDRRFLLAVFYEGPWAKLSNWCYGIRKNGTMLWEIPDDPRGLRWLLRGVAHWADVRDQMWRTKYISLQRNPPRFWKRK